MNVGLWVEVWVNPEEDYLKYDYSMWPYELPDHSPAEIYFAGALLLDPTHLLFSSRSIVPCLDYYADSLPSGNETPLFLPNREINLFSFRVKDTRPSTLSTLSQI